MAAVLSSPWRLFLAATAYQDKAADPSELTRLAPDRIPSHLLDQLIPAVTRHTPGSNGRYYPPGEVRTWLTTLAAHLDQTSSNPRLRWSPADLPLQQLWPVAGRKPVQRLTALTVIALAAIASALSVFAGIADHLERSSGSMAAWIGLGVLIVYTVYNIGASIINTDPVLSRLSLDIKVNRRRRTLAFGMALGMAALPAALPAALLAFELAVDSTVGLAAGLTTWIRYTIGCGLARRQGLLPPQLGRFLDWAYHAGLLRMSGTAIQFRHRELQEWLSRSARN